MKKIKTAKELEKEWRLVKLKQTREYKRKMVAEVCLKDKAETVKDICTIYYGLSRKSIESIAYNKILRLSGMGLSPVEIIKTLGARNGNL